jgi:hypothetical protein
MTGTQLRIDWVAPSALDPVSPGHIARSEPLRESVRNPTL